MHRSIYISNVSKIEYAEFLSEADMNLYEIYYINLLKPPLNCDDKAKDELTVSLPDVDWKEFTTPLWEKWKNEIAKMDNEYEMRKQEQRAYFEMKPLMRRKYKNGEITDKEYSYFMESNRHLERSVI
jgi:hypothetical protein